jgi:hypothetical protein
MKKIFVGIMLSLIVQVTAQADDDLQSLKNISKDLVDIRQQIERLHDEISYEKEAYKDKMRSYSNQKADLDVKISRSELNIKDLKRELEKVAAKNKEKNRSQNVIAPVLKKSIASLRSTVSQSLPFKLEQRLEALDNIEHRMDAGIISSNKAANQLWAFVEDELMLGRSNGLYNDTIKIDKQDKLAKVLRIGKIALFYKTRDGQFGVFKRNGEQWERRSINDGESITQLEQLFDSFAKNIRDGQFTTPNFLPRS